MRTLILALAAAAILGLAAPAFANDGAARGTVQTQSQDFSSSHRHHWRHRHHHWRHHYGWGGYQNCFKVWRYGRLVTVCR
jgi:Ni/Co efflux regulator RcnB